MVHLLNLLYPFRRTLLESFFVSPTLSLSATNADLWAYVPGQDLINPGGSWTRLPPGANGLVPPPMAEMNSVYDDVRDNLYVWGGVYETFSSGGQDPATLLWQYSWSAPFSVLSSLPVSV